VALIVLVLVVRLLVVLLLTVVLVLPVMLVVLLLVVPLLVVLLLVPLTTIIMPPPRLVRLQTPAIKKIKDHAALPVDAGTLVVEILTVVRAVATTTETNMESFCRICPSPSLRFSGTPVLLLSI